jgi:CubicO group peptidase (beta-lactamase class C family)
MTFRTIVHRCAGPSAAVLLLAGLKAPGPLPTAAVRDTTLARAADSYLAGWQALGTFSGVVLVARGDRVVLEKGYGMASYELGVPNTPEREFRIASVSKPFTEIAIARLANEGKLTFDTPLSRFVPEYPKGDQITIRMLMEHRAGVPNVNSIPYDEEAVQANTLDSLVAVLEARPLDFPPGTRRSYSNGGYALLARVIERASGQSYPDYLRAAVLRPLGLEETGDESEWLVVDGKATGYQPSPVARGRLAPAPYQQMATKQGGGSLYSTAHDLFRFSRALYRNNVIAAADYRDLFPPRDSLIEFQGRSAGYMTLVRKRLEPDLTIIILANNYAAMVDRIADALTAIADGGQPDPVPWRADVVVDSATANALAGDYAPPARALPFLPPGTPLEVRARGGDLLLSVLHTPADVLMPQNDTTFLLRNLWGSLTFHRDGGRVTGLHYEYLFRPGGFDASRSPAPATEGGPGSPAPPAKEPRLDHPGS